MPSALKKKTAKKNNVQSRKRLLSIGQASSLLGVSIDTLRNWEEGGKLISQRVPGGIRRYSLTLLKKLQKSDPKLAEKKVRQAIKDPSSEPEIITITTIQTIHTIPQYIKRPALFTFYFLLFTFLLTSSLVAGYVFKPEATKQILGKSSDSQQILGASSDSSLFNYTLDARRYTLAPFNSLAQALIQTFAPQKAVELGFEQESRQGQVVSIKGLEEKNQELLEKLSQTDSRLLTLDSRLSSVSTTTTNLLRNSSFEKNPLGQPDFWFYTNNSADKNTFVNNASVRSGYHALRIEPKDGNTSFGIYQPYFTTLYKRSYTLSLYINNQSNDDFTLKLGFWDKNNNKRIASKEFTMATPDVEEETSGVDVGYGISGAKWQRYTFTLDPSNQDLTGLDFYPMVEILRLRSGQVYLDDIQLEEGTSTSTFAQENMMLGDGSVFVDALGNIFPTTNRTGSLGTNDFRFNALYLTKGSIDKDGNTNIGGNLTVDGDGTLQADLAVNGGDITTSNTNFNLLNSNVLTLNIGGAATSIGLGSSSAGGTTTINNNLSVTGTSTFTGATTSTGGILLPDGSSATPALRFTNDTDSGLYRLAANVISLITGGTAGKGITIDSSGNLGVGTTAPTTMLEVIDDIFTQDNLYVGSTSESLANTGFSLDGDDLFVAGMAGIEGNIYTDGSLILGSSTTISNGSISQSSGEALTIGTTAADLTLQTTTSGDIVLSPSGGNVGIGTTAPLGTLHVAGQCVTGDTLLKRRRRKKGAKGNTSEVKEFGDDFEDVRIDQIQPGDEILTLDEKTGKFVTSKVHALQNMGIQDVFELTTKDGRSIKTTAEHPYLIHLGGVKAHPRGVNQTWQKVSALKPGDEIAVTPHPSVPDTFAFIDETGMAKSDPIQTEMGIGLLSFTKSSAEVSQFNQELRQVLVSALDILNRQEKKFEFKFKFVTKTSLPLYKKLLKILTKHQKLWEFSWTFEENNHQGWDQYLKLTRELLAQVKGNYTILADYLDRPKASARTLYELKELSSVADILQVESQGTIFLQVTDILLGALGFIRSNRKDKVKRELAKEVSKILFGKKKATVDSVHVASYTGNIPENAGFVNQEMIWSEITSIKSAGRGQVFDIEVEDTHNFVGNNIVAHNTIIFGAGEGGTPTTTTLRGAAGAGTNIAGANFTFDASNGTGTGGSGALIFRTAPVSTTGTTANTLAEIMRITPGGNVGIGTTAPLYALDIYGTSFPSSSMQLTRNQSGQTNYPVLTFKRGNALSDGDQIGGMYFNGPSDSSETYGIMMATATNATTYAGRLDFKTAKAGTVPTNTSAPDMSIYNGNVGIGTTNPVRGLNIYHSTSAQIYLQNSTSGATATDGMVLNTVGADITMWNYEDGYLRFGTNNAERARIDSGGNLGIGDDSPDYLLELYDTTNTPTFALSDDDVAHSFTDLVNADTFAHLTSLSTTAGGALLQSFSDGDASGFNLKVGIGTTDPTDSTPAIKLIGGKLSGTTLGDLGAAETVFQIANNDDAPALSIMGNGNVGISTTSPNNLIQVANLINFDNTNLNTQLGHQAGKNIVTGAQYNTFVGYQAGLSSTTLSTNAADNNTAIGDRAFYSNTTGLSNTAVGAMVLYSNTEGYYNTAVGMYSLYSNTTGNTNTASGNQALYLNTTGSDNTSAGYQSLLNNTTGNANTANGAYALSLLAPTSKAITAFTDYNETVAGKVKATSASHGLSAGTTAGVAITGTTNYNGTYTVTYIDANSFYFTDTWVANDATGWWGIASEGINNTALGDSAGYNIVTGSSNTFLGYYAGRDASQLTSASNSMALGNGTYTTASNQAVYGNSSMTQHIFQAGNVGIGTTAPIGKLQVNGTTVIGSAGANYGRVGQNLELNTSANYGGMAITTWSATAAEAAILDFNRSKSATVGTYTAVSSGDMLGHIEFRGSDGSAFQNAGGIRAIVNGTVSEGNHIPMDFTFYTTLAGNNESEKVRITGAGNVGIGTTSPVSLLQLRTAASSDPSFSLADGDVAHGVTTVAPTDDFLRIKPLSSTVGGTQFDSLMDGDGVALQIRGIQNADPSDTNPAIKLIAAKANGTGVQDLLDAETMLQIINNDNTAAVTVLGNGNVGIGIAVPELPLHVQGAVVQSGDGRGNVQIWDTSTAAAGVGAGIYLGGKYSAAGAIGSFVNIKGIKENANDNDYSAALGFSTSVNGGGYVEKLRITSGGNIGIGTTSPLSLLQLRTAASSDPSFSLADGDVAHGVTTVAPTDDFLRIVPISSTVGGAYINGIADATGVALQLRGIQSSDPTDSTPAIFLVGAKASGTGVVDLGDTETIFAIANNDNANALTILGNGNVGIGTTAPVSLLQLRTAAASDPSFSLADGDVAHGVTTIAPTDDFLRIVPISSTVGGAYINGIADATGVALQLRGIQSSDPTDSTPAIFLVGAKASGTGVQDLGATETVFQVANNDDAPALTILGNGNVGIGTTSPSSTLTVNNGSNAYSPFIAQDNGTAVFTINDNGTITHAPNTSITTGTLFSVAAPASTLTGALTGLNVNVSGTTPGTQAVTALSTSAFTGGSTGVNYGLNIGAVTGSGTSTNYGIYIGAISGSSTINSGLRIAGTEAGAANYAIYADSAAQSYFAGNIGIGLVDPSSPLVISKAGSGNARLSLKESNGYTNARDFWINNLEDSSTSTQALAIEARNDSNTLVRTLAYFNFNGNVGIGTASPDTLFDVNNLFNVTSAGNIGIGTTSPLAKLEVSQTDAANAEALILDSAESTNTQDVFKIKSDYFASDTTVLNVDADGSTTIGASAANSKLRASLTLNGDQVLKGKIDSVTTGMSNVVDVYVYDTTKDSDGGKWRVDERAKGSSWYNETIDNTGASCTNDTDDRCGRKEFPEKAIIVATTTDLYIFDAKDNTQWMNFDKGATTTEQMIGPTTNSTGSSVFALNGKVYYGNNGTVGQLYAIDFVRDTAKRYNATDDYVGDKTIGNRNSTVTWAAGPGSPITNTVVNDVTATVLALNGKTYVAAATPAGVSIINETDQTEASIVTNRTNHTKVQFVGTTLYFLDSNGSYVMKKTNFQNAVDGDSYSGFWSYAGLTQPYFGFTAAAYDFYVTAGTSTMDGISNTVYVASDAGLGVIQEGGNESGKYYTKDFVTEELIGQASIMWGLNADNSASDLEDLYYANPNSNLTAANIDSNDAASGVRGTSTDFDGSTENLSVATASDSEVDFNGSETFSMSFWVYPTTMPGSGEQDAIISKWDATSAQRGYRLILENDDADSTGNFQFDIYDESADQTITATTSNDFVQQDTWYHVVATFNGGQAGAANDLKLYVNGVLQDGNDANASFLGLEDVTSDLVIADYDTNDAVAANTAFTGRIDEGMITKDTITATSVKHMYEVGLRALQNHTASRITGVTGANDYQKLLGAGTAAAGVSIAKAVAVDASNQYIFVGTNDGTNNIGGVTVIGVDSDSVVDLYDSANNTGKDDDAGTQFSANDAVAISVSGTPCIGYNSGTTTCDNGAVIAIAGTNDTATRVWMQSSDYSIYSTLAQLSSPDLLKDNLTITNVFKVFNSYNNITNTTSSERIETPAFMVDQRGNLVAQSLVNSTTAMQFKNASGTTLLNLDTTNGNVGIGTTAPAEKLEVVGGNIKVGAGYVVRTDGITNSANNVNSLMWVSGNHVGINDNKLYVTSAGNVGIGTTAPAALLHVAGGATQLGSGSWPTVTMGLAGQRVGMFSDTEDGMLAVGNMASGVGANRGGILYLGARQTDATANFAYSSIVGAKENATSGNSLTYLAFQVSGGLEKVRIDSSGNLGIGTTAPTAQLELSTAVAIKSSGTAWDNPSDIRLKNIERNYGYGLDEIMQINPIVFTFKVDNALGINDPGEHIGIVAQEVQKVIPEAVTEGAGGYLKFNIDPILWASVNAIKELNTQVASLSAQLDQQKATLSGDLSTENNTNVLSSDLISVNLPQNIENVKFNVDLTGIEPANSELSDPSVHQYQAHTTTLSSIISYLVNANLAQEELNKQIAAVQDSLKVEEDGTIKVANLKAERIVLGPEVGNTGLALDGEGNIDLELTLENQQTQVLGLEEKIATQEAQIARLDAAIELASQSESQRAETKSALDELKDTVASLSAQITSTSGVSPGSPEVDNLNLTPPELLIATGSATLVDLSVSSEATFSGKLRAYGDTFLGNTIIAGNFSIDGTLSISENSINAIGANSSPDGGPQGLLGGGILYIQNSPLAEMADFFNGVVTIDKNGTLAVKKIELPQDVLGEAAIPQGQIEIPIFTAAITEKSKIFITPLASLKGQNLVISGIVPGSGFVVSLEQPLSSDIKFNWVILDNK